MPSGAKKRKAAKKKLQNKGSNSNSNSNSQGNDDPKYHDEKDNGGVRVEREGNVEGVDVKNYDEQGSKEVSLGERNVRSDDLSRESRNGKNKSSSSSSSNSSSSSDDDEVIAEKKSANPESGKVEVSVENSGVSEVVNKAVEESIPKEESVKQVVSLPHVSSNVSESERFDNSLSSDLINLGLKQDVDESLQQFDEKIEISSQMEKIEENLIQGVDGVSGRYDEGLLPQSSGVEVIEECCAGDDCKASKTHKYPEEKPLLPSAPVQVRRTSWMDCCGLFEVFSGGSSR